MTVKRRRGGLGKGLEALLNIGRSDPEESGAEEPTEEGSGGRVASPLDGELRQLPVEWLQRGLYQPRREMDPAQLEDLAGSIRAQGVVQPIVVRPLMGEAQRYEIIAGERRWRAAQMAGLYEIPALIRQIPDQTALAVALIENIQREDLNPMEEATALQRLIDEFNLTHQSVAEAVGRSRTAVTNLLRLLTLQPEVRRLLEHGDLEMGHARALLALGESQQLEIARQVVDKRLTVRETEALVKRIQEGRAQPLTVAKPTHPDVARLQQQLAERIGAPVAIQQRSRDKGQLVIRYNSLDELDGILQHIH